MARGSSRNRRRDAVTKRSLPSNSIHDLYATIKPVQRRIYEIQKFNPTQNEGYVIQKSIPLRRPNRRIDANHQRNPGSVSASKDFVSPGAYRVVSESPTLKTVCETRKERKEVLFAQGHTGRGSRPGFWTKSSKIRCK